MDAAGSPTLLNCLMYKLAYFRFGEVQVRPSPVSPLCVCVCMRVQYNVETDIATSHDYMVPYTFVLLDLPFAGMNFSILDNFLLSIEKIHLL